MPELESLPNQDVKLLYVPSTQGLPEEQRGWVKMDVSPLNTRDYVFAIAPTDDTFGKIGVSLLTERIKEWNFTEKGSTDIAPINQQTVLGLGKINLDFLSNQILQPPAGAQLTTAEKKS